jgi:PPPDE putative peptidase domain.
MGRKKILERFSHDYNPYTYNILTHNCQQYFAEVLQQAQKYATKEKPLVLP